MKLTHLSVVISTLLLTSQCSAMNHFSLFGLFNKYFSEVLFFQRHYGSCNIFYDYHVPASRLVDVDNEHNPLYKAVADNDLPLIESLLSKGAFINSVDINGCTPLHEAVRSRNIKAVKLLLCYGADSTLKDNQDNEPLSLNILGKSYASDQIKAVINSYRQLFADGTSKEAFKKAIEQGYLSLVKLFISRGVSVTSADLQLAKKSWEKAEHKSIYRAIGRLLLYYLRLTGDLEVPEQTFVQHFIGYMASSVLPQDKRYAQVPIAQNGLVAAGLPKEIADIIARLAISSD